MAVATTNTGKDDVSVNELNLESVSLERYSDFKEMISLYIGEKILECEEEDKKRIPLDELSKQASVKFGGMANNYLGRGSRFRKNYRVLAEKVLLSLGYEENGEFGVYIPGEDAMVRILRKDLSELIRDD